MNRSWHLWALALLITLASAVYQRLTGPTYPVSGTSRIGSSDARYRLLRSHETSSPAPVEISTADTAISGRLDWRRYKTADAWTSVHMKRGTGLLSAEIPPQPAAGKVEYRIILARDSTFVTIPNEGGVVLRFKGEVPLAILIAHVIAMFGGMLLSTRAGLEVFRSAPQYPPLMYWTIGLLALGGIVLGPIVQKYAFDAFWTGWPFGHDLTDNKTVVALLCWIVAVVASRRGRNPKAWVIGAALVTLIVFAIPHSVLGSELQYNETGHGVNVDSLARP